MLERKFQAEVALDGLLTRNNLPEKYQGESRSVHRHEGIKVKYNPFKVLTAQLCEWLLDEKCLNYVQFQCILEDCVDLMGKNPSRYSKSTEAKLARFLLKYPRRFILDRHFRKTLYAVNGFEHFMPTPRAWRSESWNPWRGYRRILSIVPGRKKTWFLPHKYVGVGYRDKGNCRNPALQGDPHYWEVAMDRRNTDELTKRKRSLEVDRNLDHLRNLRFEELARKQRRLMRKRRLESEFSLLD